jgi:uncharacterized oxidoreductase
VSGFIDSIFEQLKEGKTALTYEFTEAMSRAGQEVFEPVFARINPESAGKLRELTADDADGTD